MNVNNPIVVTRKLVVLGDHAVGKTSIVLRYIEKKIDRNVSPPIGATFSSCTIRMDKNVSINLQIWDTAGQERFKAIAPMFYRNANAALLVFDITKPATFENIKQWVEELKDLVANELHIYIIGSKTDLGMERRISENEAIEYSNSLGARYMECSASLDKGISEIFQMVASELVKGTSMEVIKQHHSNEGSTGSTINISKSRSVALRRAKCCPNHIV